jgi:peroxiredoxin
VTPVAISVDTPEESRDLSTKAGYTFPILSDRNTDVIRKYDLLHKGGGMQGRDISRPAEFLVDRSGTVRWRNLTEDIRVRATPEKMLEQARTLRFQAPN